MVNVLATCLAALIAMLTLAGEHRRSRRCSLGHAEATFVVTALQAFSLELRCGRSPLEALGGIHSSGLESGASALWAGAAEAETMSGAARCLDQGVPALQAVAGALRLAETLGCSLAGLIDAILDPLRDQQRAETELVDALAGVRSSANLLTGLPVLGIVLAEGIGARPLDVLFHTVAGAACLVLGTGLGGLGRMWTGMLVERARLVGRA